MAPVVDGAKALVRGDVAARRRDILLTIFMIVITLYGVVYSYADDVSTIERRIAWSTEVVSRDEERH